MKMNLSTAIMISISAVVVAIIVYDAAVTYSAIKNNQKILEHLDKTRADMEAGIKDTRVKIQKFQTDPRAAEAILRQKFQMLKKDQFIIHD